VRTRARERYNMTEPAPPAVPADDGGGSPALLAVIVLASVCVAALVGWRMRSLRRWRLRAHSAKVLDEIEMEFVNDDADLFEDDSDLRIIGSRGGTSTTWGQESERSRAL